VSYQVFARKYRPRTFDDVLGQDHVVRTLKNAITQNRLAHAYLFVGPRGTGKTSTARIFAKALNCPNGPRIDYDPDDPECEAIARGESLDVIEIDGASNNGVEQVRELREGTRFAATSGKFKIYYIDEVHMLTANAFNALLKTLEEPPPHVKFIFATTEAHKILPTIISRCQRFDLRRIPANIIAEHLLHIAEQEGVNLENKAAFAIAKGADGGMRDAQSMLDQLVAFCGNHIEEQHVLEIFGFTPQEAVCNVTQAILDRNTVAALQLVATHAESGKDLGRFLADLIEHLRGVLVLQADPQAVDEDLPPELAEQTAAQAKAASTEQLLRIVDGLAETDARMRWASNKRLHLELAVIQAVETLHEVSISDVMVALDKAGASAADAVNVVTARRAAASTAPALTVSAKAPAEPVPVAAPAQIASAPQPAEPELAFNLDLPTAAAPAAFVESDQLWQSIQPIVQAKRPLIANWTCTGGQLSFSRNILKVGFHSNDAFSRDSLSRPATKQFLEEQLTELAGQPVKLEFVLDDQVKIAAPQPAPVEPAPVVQAAVQAPLAPAPEAPEANQPEAPVADDFYDDPLIKLALQRFKAKVLPEG
jgi:DNA polymerase III subunit gamma/tau